jgi:hypothetical protein
MAAKARRGCFYSGSGLPKPAYGEYSRARAALVKWRTLGGASEETTNVYPCPLHGYHIGHIFRTERNRRLGHSSTYRR